MRVKFGSSETFRSSLKVSSASVQSSVSKRSELSLRHFVAAQKVLKFYALEKAARTSHLLGTFAACAGGADFTQCYKGNFLRLHGHGNYSPRGKIRKRLAIGVTDCSRQLVGATLTAEAGEQKAAFSF